MSDLHQKGDILMDFLDAFLSSFSKPPKLSPGISAETLLGRIYEEEKDLPGQSLLSIRAYGSHYILPPFSYSFHSFPCYLLLYTTNGCGTLQTKEKTFLLKEMSLLFFQCSQPFSLSVSGHFWNFEAYFCTGSLFSTFYRNQKGTLWDLEDSPEILRHLQMLETNNRTPLRRNHILDLKCFTNLFSDLILMREPEANPKKNFPGYLLYMKKCFDYSYTDHYSLTDFEQKLSVSKYRLCREFTTVYGTSPLRYLNQRRIEAAKDLLNTTNMSVHDVGCSVGFENTNHFISLFKRDAGTTPNAYRKEKSASQTCKE